MNCLPLQHTGAKGGRDRVVTGGVGASRLCGNCSKRIKKGKIRASLIDIIFICVSSVFTSIIIWSSSTCIVENCWLSCHHWEKIYHAGLHIAAPSYIRIIVLFLLPITASICVDYRQHTDTFCFSTVITV